MDRFGLIEDGTGEAAGTHPEQARLRRIAQLIGCDVDDLTAAEVAPTQPLAQAGELLQLYLSLSETCDRRAVLNLARSLSRD